MVIALSDSLPNRLGICRKTIRGQLPLGGSYVGPQSVVWRGMRHSCLAGRPGDERQSVCSGVDEALAAVGGTRGHGAARKRARPSRVADARERALGHTLHNF